MSATIQLGVWLSVGDQPPVHVGTADVEAKTTATTDGITIEAGAAMGDALRQAADALTSPVYRAADQGTADTLGHVTVDGEAITMQYGHHGVARILNAAGVDAHTHDLLRVDGDGHTATHRTGDTVTLQPGDEFVTARISTT